MIATLALLTLPTAHAAALSVYGGTRDSFTEAATLEGVRAGARLSTGSWEAQLGGYVAGSATRITDRHLVELSIAGEGTFNQVTDVDRWTVDLTGSWGPRLQQGWAGAPRLVAGLELRQVARTWRFLDGDEAQPVVVGTSNRLAPGAVIGFALDARLNSPLGLRLGVFDRLWWGDNRAYDVPLQKGDELRLFQDPTLTLDLSWQFGGGEA